jgi:hypothetical protein
MTGAKCLEAIVSDSEPSAHDLLGTGTWSIARVALGAGSGGGGTGAVRRLDARRIPAAPARRTPAGGRPGTGAPVRPALPGRESHGHSLHGVGSLGMVMLGHEVTVVVPAAWWVLLASMIADGGLGFAWILVRRT